MVVGMAGTEAEVEAQHVEGGVGLEVIQNEEKLLVERVEFAFRPARRHLADFPPLEPFRLKGVVGGSEGRREYVELRTAHTDEGFDDAVMFLGIQFYESFVGHGLSIFLTETILYCTTVFEWGTIVRNKSIDDPISSLDSNHVFFVFSLIDSIIAKPKKYTQLFISTHNLDFLKYIKITTHNQSNLDKKWFV